MIKVVQVTEIVNKTEDIVCDICGKSCETEYGFEFMKLGANWGYMSGKDLEKWEAQVCENCVDTHLSPLIKFKRTSSIGGREL